MPSRFIRPHQSSSRCICTASRALDHYRRLLRLYLPESWTKDGKRREEAGIPEEVVFKTKWQLSLDMIDQVRTGAHHWAG